MAFIKLETFERVQTLMALVLLYAIYLLLGGVDPQTGLNVPVEIDESYFFHRKYHQGVQRNGQWVFGIVERGTKKCYLEAVPNKLRATLEAIITARIVQGSTIYSDSARMYNHLGTINGYTHHAVNHHVNFVDQQNPHIHTQTIEGKITSVSAFRSGESKFSTISGVWSHIKSKIRHMKGTRRDDPDLFDGYLQEFGYFRCHRDEFKNRMFSRLLFDITEQYPV